MSRGGARGRGLPEPHEFLCETGQIRGTLPGCALAIDRISDVDRKVVDLAALASDLSDEGTTAPLHYCPHTLLHYCTTALLP